MDKSAELELFLAKADDFMSSNYIISDIKLVNLLKVIATSNTLLSIFQTCLEDFDYEEAKKKYLVKEKSLFNKGEFVLPSNSKELLAFVFRVLIDIDAKKIDLNSFINVYFSREDNFAESYKFFMNSVIKPFRDCVLYIAEKVVDGDMKDLIDKITDCENKFKLEKDLKIKKQKESQESTNKAYLDAVSGIKEILSEDRIAVLSKKCKNTDEILIILDAFGNIIDSNDKDKIIYSFLAYKYMAMSSPKIFAKSVDKIIVLLKDVFNAI